MTFSKLFSKTFPYILLRVFVALSLIFAFTIYSAMCIGIVSAVSGITGANSVVPLITGLVLFGIAFGFWRFLKSVILYAVKAGHIAVISELIAKGDLPAGTNVISYGKDMVKNFFVASSAMWLLDVLINKAVSEIRRKLDTFSSNLSFIPGASFIIAIFGVFVGVLLNYSDEAVFAYVFQKGKENVWKSAADGIVLYVQNWKQMMKSAAIVSLLLVVSAGLSGLIGYGILLSSDALQGQTAILLIICGGIFLFLKWGIVDPMVMIYMVKEYMEVSLNSKPAIDMYSKIEGASAKFREIVAKSGGAELQTAAVAAGAGISSFIPSPISNVVSGVTQEAVPSEQVDATSVESNNTANINDNNQSISS